MDSIKEFFKHINYRLSSPFIFSFILSFLISNWQIPVGLIWANSELLKADSFKKYTALLTDTVTWRTGFEIPFIAALVYTALNPALTVVIHAIQTFFQKIGDDLNLRILKGGKISIDKYIELKRELDERKHILEEVTNQERTAIVDLEKSNTEVLSLSKELNEQKKKASDFENLYNKSRLEQSPNLLQGFWKSDFTFSDGRKGSEIIEVKGRDMFQITNEKKILLANIQHFRYDEPSHKVFFVKRMNRQRSSREWGGLMIVADYNYFQVDGSLSGYEDGDIKITLTPLSEELKEFKPEQAATNHA